MLLPDVNVWLALTFDSHIHHPDAKKWFDALSDQVCYFCRITQLGFLRLATNHKVFGVHALTLAQAWQEYDKFQSDARVSFADEPAQVESQWRSWTQNQTFSPQVWNDAYLAAFAQVAGLELVTFDKGFAKYTGSQHGAAEEKLVATFVSDDRFQGKVIRFRVPGKSFRIHNEQIILRF